MNNPAIRTVRPCVATATLFCIASATFAASPAMHPAGPHFRTATDATWVRAFASPSTGNLKGHENALTWDPRFLPLLQSSFPQKQWFWHDHGRFAPVPDLVQTFIGVPGSAILDDNRYVTANGCVPHDCTDGGMLWIDTGTRPATLIFAATQMILNVQGGNDTHLWLFASQHLNFENLPAAFLASLERWHNTVTSNPYNKEDITLATLVQPTGEQIDLTYPTLYYQKNEPGAKK